MDLKEKLIKIKEEIEMFLNIKTGRTETVAKKYSFVKMETAQVIQKAVKEIILGKGGRNQDEFNSYLDLCFGSGNLSIHILEALDFFELDNNNNLKIKDDKVVIFNDKNNFANWSLCPNPPISTTSIQNNSNTTPIQSLKCIKEDVFNNFSLLNIEDKKFDFITANFLIKASEDDTIGAIKLDEDRKKVLTEIFNNLLSQNGIFLFVKNSKSERDFEELTNIFGKYSYYITISDITGLGQDLNLISKMPIIKELEIENE